MWEAYLHACVPEEEPGEREKWAVGGGGETGLEPRLEWAEGLPGLVSVDISFFPGLYPFPWHN